MEHKGITEGEFTRAMHALERQMAAGFRGLHKRLDGLDCAVQDQGERVAAVEAVQADCQGHGERLASLETLRESADASTKKRAVTWGGGVAGLLWLLEITRQYFTMRSGG